MPWQRPGVCICCSEKTCELTGVLAARPQHPPPDSAAGRVAMLGRNEQQKHMHFTGPAQGASIDAHTCPKSHKEGFGQGLVLLCFREDLQLQTLPYSLSGSTWQVADVAGCGCATLLDFCETLRSQEGRPSLVVARVGEPQTSPHRGKSGPELRAKQSHLHFHPPGGPGARLS